MFEILGKIGMWVLIIVFGLIGLSLTMRIIFTSYFSVKKEFKDKEKGDSENE